MYRLEPSLPGKRKAARISSLHRSETLAGRGESLKGYAIALAVFGRGASFDPQADPVVRLEARRLRRDLDSYYMEAGQYDPVRISIPKGSYVPISIGTTCHLSLPRLVINHLTFATIRTRFCDRCKRGKQTPFPPQFTDRCDIRYRSDRWSVGMDLALWERATSLELPTGACRPGSAF